jgi:hypothetical protein
MASDHDEVKPPENPNQKIWRYVKFPQFVSMLATKALWFARIDQFDDHLEGSYPSQPVKITKEILEANPAFDANGLITRIRGGAQRMWEFFSGHTYFNCWHMNDTENDGMWRLYGDISTSVCIQSTYSLLKEATPSNVYAGVVEYIDYASEDFKVTGAMNLFLHKDRCFEHECELRAVIFDPPLQLTPNLVPHRLTISGEVERAVNILETVERTGIACNVDLNKLIESIVLPPKCSRWFAEAVSSVVSKYELECLVNKSVLDRVASKMPNYVIDEEVQKILEENSDNNPNRPIASLIREYPL